MPGPAGAASHLGAIDAVLLSHDDRAYNLDDAGRALLRAAGTVVTIAQGRRAPGSYARSIRAWHVRAVLELTSRGWRGVAKTPGSVAEIERLRRRAEATPDTSPGRRDASRPPMLARIGGYPWIRG